MMPVNGGLKSRKALRNGIGGPKKKLVSPSLVFASLFLVIIGIYVTVVAWFSMHSSSPLRRNDSNKMVPSEPEHGSQAKNNFHDTSNAEGKTKAELEGLELLKKNTIPPIKKHFQARPKGEGIKPQALLQDTTTNKIDDAPGKEVHPDPNHIMKAYVEPIHYDDWKVKPLPVRTTATKDQLEEISFTKVNSCKSLPERWPADEYPDQDTFLPWIHDVFPTDDGQFIQVVAENRRRCHTGTTDKELEILFKTQPSAALFQHVPVKRIHEEGQQEPRYRLSSHEEADPDGVATRFICRFKPSMEETLSVFNFDYDWAAHRKKQKATFKFEDGGIKSVHTAQLLFKCPVPESLQEKIRTGETIVDDFATIFLDLIPIRTPPRYGYPNQFLQPRYKESMTPNEEHQFKPETEWGSEHILPKVEDSGRWENIPICETTSQKFFGEPATSKEVAVANPPKKKHRLISCMWASAGYATRGNRFAINDGQRRLLEWVHYNKLIGVDHFYLYDNSYAFSNDTTLKPIADLFPDDITYIKWPFQVCNNNPNNVDSPGDRSSQYAAEASCRLRFGPHTEWIAQFDMDEYLIPMGNYNSILPLLNKLEDEGKKIISFGSWRAWPRRDFIAYVCWCAVCKLCILFLPKCITILPLLSSFSSEPVPIDDNALCGRNQKCFELEVPFEHTMLQTYNCDRQSGPKKKVMPAEKQIYKPEYVHHHYVHYSTVTALSELSQSEFAAAGYDWKKTRAFPDPNSRFGDELNEAAMLHTKAVARQDTVGWLQACMDKYKGGFMCRIGVPFPENYDEKKHGTGDEKGWAYNCYPNKKVDSYYAPLLEKAINKEHGHIFQKE